MMLDHPGPQKTPLLKVILCHVAAPRNSAPPPELRQTSVLNPLSSANPGKNATTNGSAAEQQLRMTESFNGEFFFLELQPTLFFIVAVGVVAVIFILLLTVLPSPLHYPLLLPCRSQREEAEENYADETGRTTSNLQERLPDHSSAGGTALRAKSSGEIMSDSVRSCFPYPRGKSRGAQNPIEGRCARHSMSMDSCSLASNDDKEKKAVNTARRTGGR